jgi:FkbM family methyltransferase
MIRPILPDRPSFSTSTLVFLLALSGFVLIRIHGRLYDAAAKLIAMISGKGRHCTAEVDPRVRFTFDLGDFYWNRLVYDGFHYEPELMIVLRMFKGIRYSFIDCGANYGYWSALVASGNLGDHTVLAIEANPKTATNLRRNSAAYPAKITVLEKAIAEESGLKLSLYERGSHAGASLQNRWLGNDKDISDEFLVETISVDDASALVPTDHPILVKLDVEGVEIQALKGAKRTIAQDSLFIVEELALDMECSVIAHLLSNDDIEVFFMSDDGVLEKISSIDRVRRIKKHTRRGYNFLATRPGTSFHSALIANSATRRGA